MSSPDSDETYLSELDAGSRSRPLYSDSDTSSLLTLTDSVRQDLFRIQQGRRHQNLNSDYQLPADAVSVKCEIICQEGHKRLYKNGMYYEPYEGALVELLKADRSEGRRRVLDLGSGLTGNWAIEMAERFPHVDVTGVDLVPCELSFYPPNLELEIHDLLEGLPYPDEYFSLIHARTLSSVSKVVTDRFLEDCLRCLRPGGVLMMDEPDELDLQPTFPAHQLPAIRARTIHHFKGLRQTSTIFQRDSERSYHLGPEVEKGIRATPGFDQSRIYVSPFELGIGVNKEDDVPFDKQAGYAMREQILTWWQFSAASNVPPPSMAELDASAQVDRNTLPLEDIGLKFVMRIIWAVKA